jgi:hypothetical protein
MSNNQQQLVKAPKRIKRELPIALTDQEFVEYGQQIGKLRADEKALIGQAKVAVQEWKDRIGSVKSRMNDLADRLHEGKASKIVDCEERYDYRLQQVDVVVVQPGLKETGKVLETRPMTPEERQPNLPIVEESETKDAELPKPKRGRRGKKDVPAATAAEPEPVELEDGDGAEPSANDVDPDGPPPDEHEVTDPSGVLGDDDSFAD